MARRKYMTSAPVGTFLAFVANQVRAAGGYVTSKEARERGGNSTAWTAWVSCDRERASLDGVMPVDVATAKDALTTALASIHQRALAGARTEFEASIQNAVNSGSVTKANLSIVAYIIPMAAKIREAAANPAPAAPPSTSTFLGSAGERITVEGTVKDVREISTVFGPSYLVKVADAAGNLVVTFLRAEPDFGSGASITLRGTVKAHKEFRGTKETQVNRPRSAPRSPATAPPTTSPRTPSPRPTPPSSSLAWPAAARSPAAATAGRSGENQNHDRGRSTKRVILNRSEKTTR